MRRNNGKPSSQNGGGYNNQHRRGRHHSGGGGQNSGGNHNRPRRNYSAAREKYLAQARDALASGDRVLAENYYQHAEHCYRMMVEEGYNPRAAQQQNEQRAENGAPANDAAANEGGDNVEEMVPANTNALPAFITSTAFPSMEQEMAKEPVIVQNWEEQ